MERGGGEAMAIAKVDLESKILELNGANIKFLDYEVVQGDVEGKKRQLIIVFEFENTYPRKQMPMEVVMLYFAVRQGDHELKRGDLRKSVFDKYKAELINLNTNIESNAPPVGVICYYELESPDVPIVLTVQDITSKEVYLTKIYELH